MCRGVSECVRGSHLMAHLAPAKCDTPIFVKTFSEFFSGKVFHCFQRPQPFPVSGLKFKIALKGSLYAGEQSDLGPQGLGGPFERDLQGRSDLPQRRLGGIAALIAAEDGEYLPDYEALEAAYGLAFGLALGHLFVHVGFGPLIMADAVYGDGVDGAVRLPVPSAIEPMTCGLSA